MLGNKPVFRKRSAGMGDRERTLYPILSLYKVTSWNSFSPNENSDNKILSSDVCVPGSVHSTSHHYLISSPWKHYGVSPAEFLSYFKDKAIKAESKVSIVTQLAKTRERGKEIQAV